MKCPRCSKSVTHRSTACEACGYTLADVQSLYGSNHVQMDRLHDAAHCLLKGERDKLDELFDKLERRFPQLCFFAYLGALPEGTRLNELSFWLMNHATIQTSDVARPRENGILLLLDTNSQWAGLTLGYFVEHYLRDEDLSVCLRAGQGQLAAGNYGEGLRLLFNKMGKVLARRSRHIKRLPQPAEPSLLNPFGADVTGLPSLRSTRRVSPLMPEGGDRVYS